MAIETLLCDLGNSSLKWCLASNVAVVCRVTHAQLMQSSCDGLIAALQKMDEVVIASVASDGVREQLVAIIQQQGVKVINLDSESERMGVNNAYTDTTSLGIDRWLVLLAVHHLFHDEHVLIVDCGSAVTVDLLQANGQHLGGRIMPGFGLMRESLVHKTGLPLVGDSRLTQAVFGRSTSDCIRLGLLQSIVGLITLSRQSAEAQLKARVRVVLTGGDADKIKTNIAFHAVIEDNLVFQGMLVVLGRMSS